jgi:hypothetical protein
MNNYLSSHLSPIIPQAQIKSLLETTTILAELPVDTRAAVLKVFAEGYNVVLEIALGFTAAQFLSICFMWKKKQVSIFERI